MPDCGGRGKWITGAIVLVLLVVTVIAVILGVVLTREEDDDDNRSIPREKFNFSEEFQEDLEEFDDEQICPENASSLLPDEEGPYLNLTESQLIFFTTQGTQRQRLAQFADRYVYRPKYQRKELRQLTDEEWDQYVQAVLATSQTYPDQVADNPNTQNFSQYQIFLALHNGANSPYAHDGAAFLPWHREYLLRFERVLRDHQENVTIPYWDSSLDELLPDARDSILFSDRFFGHHQGPVTDGRFPNFSTVPACECIDTIVKRDAKAAKPDKRGLFTAAKFSVLSTKTSFRSFTFGEGRMKNESNHTLERYHDLVHVWIGGHMGEVPCAPTDPIFWSHHGFIDYLWEEFREKQSLHDRLYDYPEDIHADNGGLAGHHPYEPMIPFEPMVNIEGLSDKYTGHLYSYSKRPSLIHCDQQSDCNSRFLWCDVSDNKCKSKVHENCSGLPDIACYCENGQPMCDNGSCECQ